MEKLEYLENNSNTTLVSINHSQCNLSNAENCNSNTTLVSINLVFPSKARSAISYSNTTLVSINPRNKKK